MIETPSLLMELRRGLNLYNLSVGFVTAVALGAATFFFIPDLFDIGRGVQSILAALASFLLITAIHTATHAYFGWRFGRGVTASRAGDHRRATALLSPLDRQGLDHYDISTAARQALSRSRAALENSD
ncbi:MAG TPA: hypothetical protein VHL58_00570 [Thermoanaerobaculia bacterium]|nr:hypothetical protein [Thermoanaerobaculia bacterium]